MKSFSFRPFRPWLFALLGLLLILPQACDSTNRKSPQAVAQAFLDAISAGDYAGAKDYCTAATRDNLAMYESISKFGANPASGNPKTTREELNGDYATVYYEKEGKEHFVKLRKEDGEWLVLANKADLGGFGDDKKGSSLFDLDTKIDKDDAPEPDDSPDPAELYRAERQGKSAKDVGIAFLDAWFARDYETAGHFASKSTMEAMKMKQGLDDEKKKAGKPGHYKFMDVSEQEMTAELTYFDHGDDQEHTLKLVRDQYENWEVAMEKTELPSTE
jgi:Domain of unknown function (DUF4878)